MKYVLLLLVLVFLVSGQTGTASVAGTVMEAHTVEGTAPRTGR